ncbi:hypothetical protein [Macrococcus carouselicus]|uniref:LPXTG cell wall anchor domain-containing protein n=1 Tax=Macrococcus carouselicus TaxID=69969 RepID=A0A9Q8CJT8_9STAP|nr:hypothetical protein [Macrococcus carouselicus]TDM00665.1 hypothetical protein ERX40_08985 [Macrococcus carouselicus]
MCKMIIASTALLVLSAAGTSYADANEPIDTSTADETIEIISAEMPPDKTEAPVTTEVPMTDRPSAPPMTEQPVMDEPSPAVGVTEVPSTEIPLTERPTTTTPSTERPAPTTELPGSDQQLEIVPSPVQLSEESSTGQPSPVQSSEEPSTGQPSPVQSSEEPSIGQPSPVRPSEEPSTGQPSEERDIQAPSVEQPSATDLSKNKAQSDEIKIGKFYPESAEKFYKALDKQISDIMTKDSKKKEGKEVKKKVKKKNDNQTDKKNLHILPDTGEDKSYSTAFIMIIGGLVLLAFSRLKA